MLYFTARGNHKTQQIPPKRYNFCNDGRIIIEMVLGGDSIQIPASYVKETVQMGFNDWLQYYRGITK